MWNVKSRKDLLEIETHLLCLRSLCWLKVGKGRIGARQEENLALNLGLLIISSLLFLLCHVTFPAKMPHLSSMVMSFHDLGAGILLGVQGEIKREREWRREQRKEGGKRGERWRQDPKRSNATNPGEWFIFLMRLIRIVITLKWEAPVSPSPGCQSTQWHLSKYDRWM